MKSPRALFVALSLTLSAGFVGFTVSSAFAISFTGEYFNIANGAPGTGGPILGLQTGLLSSTVLAGGFPAFPQNFWSTSNPQVTKDDLGIAAPTGANGGGVHTDAAINFPASFFAGSVGTNAARNDDTFYRSVHWTSLFSTSGPVTFTLQADDHAWLFLDGVLRVDDGGVKGIAVAPAQSSVALLLGAGTHTLDLFFADVHTSNSGVILSCLGCADALSDAPEPTSLLLFGTTLLGLGVLIRRRIRRRVKQAT